MTEAAGITHNVPEFSVSELAALIKKTVESGFGLVRVRGEISGLRPASSGHVYFSLKDQNGAVLKTVCWKGKAASLRARPENGLEVICTGKITTYPGGSEYQLVLDAMEVAGAGALMAMLEKRKKDFAARGFFDPARKKRLPFLPGVIGVVTSPTGAVIRDIIHRVSDRFPVRVIVWPVAVQGAGAEKEIAAAVRGFNSPPPGVPKPDVIIVARGGGSVEDLWCFNEEEVLYAVAESVIPVISGVGHETDTTLIDYVADIRAPTPTAAAEMALPVRDDLLLYVKDSEKRLFASIKRLLTEKANVITGLSRGLPRLSDMLSAHVQRLDGISGRLSGALPAMIRVMEARLAAARLNPRLMARETDELARRLADYSSRMAASGALLLDSLAKTLSYQSKLLESYHYKKVLARGFILARDENRNLVTSSKIEPGKRLFLEFADGETEVAAK